MRGLDNLRFVEGSFWISENEQLKSLEGLENLIYVDGSSLDISDNASLVDLNGLSGLDYVWDQLVIKGNDNLENLEGLCSLYYLYTLDIEDNASLEICEACNLIALLKNYISFWLIIGGNIGEYTRDCPVCYTWPCMTI